MALRPRPPLPLTAPPCALWCRHRRTASHAMRRFSKLKHMFCFWHIRCAVFRHIRCAILAHQKCHFDTSLYIYRFTYRFICRCRAGARRTTAPNAGLAQFAGVTYLQTYVNVYRTAHTCVYIPKGGLTYLHQPDIMKVGSCVSSSPRRNGNGLDETYPISPVYTIWR